MIDDLDGTLEALLKRELPRYLTQQITITFASPDQTFPPASVKFPALNLFLYDVRENFELRGDELILERRSNVTDMQRRASVRVDCSYLITGWASDGSPTPAQDEHQLLGETLRIILRHSTIPSDLLQGSLQKPGPELPSLSIRPGHLQDVMPLWHALGRKPKAALNYILTMVIDP